MKQVYHLVGTLTLVLASVLSCGLAFGQLLPTAHTTRNIEGWNVRIDDRLIKGEHEKVGALALKLLESRLVAITVVVPEKPLAKLRNITIQLDLNHGDLVSMQYHPDAGWLKEHGYSEELAKCVHIPSVADFLEPQGIHSQPWVVLHELAHAFHDQVLGFEDHRVIAAWKKFCDIGKYKSVLTVSGAMHEHYGLTDEKEFFAEMTECYFGSNDFYPFVAGELKQDEPEIFELLSEVWGPLPGFTARPAGSAKTDTKAKPQAAATENSTRNPALEEAIKKLKIPGMAINLEQRCLDIESRVCLEKGLLELVACTKGSKEHESIVAIEAKAVHVHTALLLLGAEAGNPAMRRAPQEDGAVQDVPPRGSAVDVLLVFPDKSGKLVEHPISEFIERAAAEEDVLSNPAADKRADRKFPTHTFLFAGSLLVEDGPGPRKYLSDVNGNVISIATFGDEMLCLPGVHTGEMNALEWQVKASALPAPGTKVTLRLRPQPKPAARR
jgi:hypothetical protein